MVASRLREPRAHPRRARGQWSVVTASGVAEVESDADALARRTRLRARLRGSHSRCRGASFQRLSRLLRGGGGGCWCWGVCGRHRGGGGRSQGGAQTAQLSAGSQRERRRSARAGALCDDGLVLTLGGERREGSVGARGTMWKDVIGRRAAREVSVVAKNFDVTMERHVGTVVSYR